ncbi:MAG: hypothetical protein RI935_113 [Candidatus Parcubacteria bacterium]
MKNTCIAFMSAGVVFLFVLLLQNGNSALQVLSFDQINFWKRMGMGVSTLFDINNSFTTSSLAVSIITSLLTGVVLSLFYVYIKNHSEMIMKSGLYSGTGLLLALMGVGCAACGTVIITTLFGIAGGTFLTNVLPYNGEEFGYVGIIILLFSIHTLLKKINTPNVC